MDIVWIVQTLLGIVLGVVAWLYRDVKATAERTKEDLAAHKLHVAERYVSAEQLTKAIENLNKTIDSVAGGVARIEVRLNNQIDNHNRNSSGSN